MMENGSLDVVRRAYSWWLLELSTVLTPRRSGVRVWQTLLHQTAEGLEIVTRTGMSIQHLGTLKSGASPDEIATLKRLVQKQTVPNSKQVLLRLSSSDVVERTIQIPKAASDVMGLVVDNQMERIVPWAPDVRRYGYRVVGSNAAAPDQLDIQVVATTTGVLDAARQRAESVGLTPYAVDFSVDPEGADAVTLVSLEPDPIKKKENLLHSLLTLLLTASVAIAGLGFYSVWDRKVQSDDLEEKISAATLRVDELKRLNAESARNRQQRERLVRRKMEEPAMLVLIEALSRALPDTAYLTELQIQGREARIIGKSDDPTALITTLEDTPHFSGVQFSAPTTRVEGEKVGTFSIIGQAQGGPHLEDQP